MDPMVQFEQETNQTVKSLGLDEWPPFRVVVFEGEEQRKVARDAIMREISKMKASGWKIVEMRPVRIT